MALTGLRGHHVMQVHGNMIEDKIVHVSPFMPKNERPQVTAMLATADSVRKSLAEPMHARNAG